MVEAGNFPVENFGVISLSSRSKCENCGATWDNGAVIIYCTCSPVPRDLCVKCHRKLYPFPGKLVG